MEGLTRAWEQRLDEPITETSAPISSEDSADRTLEQLENDLATGRASTN